VTDSVHLYRVKAAMVGLPGRLRPAEKQRPKIGPAYRARRASGTGNWDQPRHTACSGRPLSENPTYSAFWSVFGITCPRLQGLDRLDEPDELSGLPKRAGLNDRLSHSRARQDVTDMSNPAPILAPPSLRDPDDLPVLACAISAGVDAIITGDNNLLSLKTFEGISRRGRASTRGLSCAFGRPASDTIGEGRLCQMAARRLVVWHQYRNDLAAVTAVDAKIRVECENSRILVQFR